MGAPCLHYFNCRSRGQALRFALVDAGIAFRDDRYPIDQLDKFRHASRRGDMGGPFGSLPVLEWDGYFIAQTLPVAGYLAHRLGHMCDRSSEERFFLDMITSAAHLDMQAPYTQLFWRPADDTRERLATAARTLFDALARKLAQLDSLLQRTSQDTPFFGGHVPVMADYFVYESIARAVATFGAGFVDAVQRTSRLASLAEAVSRRPAIAEYLSRGGVPDAITASPSEAALRPQVLELGLRTLGRSKDPHNRAE